MKKQQLCCCFRYRILTEGERPVPRTWHTFTAFGSTLTQILLFGGYSQRDGNTNNGDPLGKPQGLFCLAL